MNLVLGLNYCISLFCKSFSAYFWFYFISCLPPLFVLQQSLSEFITSGGSLSIHTSIVLGVAEFNQLDYRFYSKQCVLSCVIWLKLQPFCPTLSQSGQPVSKTDANCSARCVFSFMDHKNRACCSSTKGVDNVDVFTTNRCLYQPNQTDLIRTGTDLLKYCLICFYPVTICFQFIRYL